MQLIKVLLVAVFVACMGVPRAAQAGRLRTAAVSVDDHTLESRINARLKADPSLAGYSINVDADEGTVTIEGTVQNEAQRAQAQRLATIPGVKTVKNEIAVDPTATPKAPRANGAPSSKTDRAVDKAREGTDKGLEAAKKGTDEAVDATRKAVEKGVDSATVVKDAGKNVGEKVGGAFSDGWITTKIKSKMVNDSIVRARDVKVETNDHVVTLSGTVPSTAAKLRAEELARTTDGVTRVVNLIEVAK